MALPEDTEGFNTVTVVFNGVLLPICKLLTCPGVLPISLGYSVISSSQISPVISCNTGKPLTIMHNHRVNSLARELSY